MSLILPEDADNMLKYLLKKHVRGEYINDCYVDLDDPTIHPVEKIALINAMVNIPMA